MSHSWKREYNTSMCKIVMNECIICQSHCEGNWTYTACIVDPDPDDDDSTNPKLVGWGIRDGTYKMYKNSTNGGDPCPSDINRQPCVHSCVIS